MLIAEFCTIAEFIRIASEMIGSGMCMLILVYMQDGGPGALLIVSHNHSFLTTLLLISDYSEQDWCHGMLYPQILDATFISTPVASRRLSGLSPPL